MLTKEQIAQFRSAPWKGADQVAAWMKSLGELAPPDVLQLLDALLTHPDDGERQRARCYAFERLAERVTDRSLFLPFVNALKTPQKDVRALVARRLPAVADTPRIAELCALVKSDDASLRETACNVLRQIGGRPVFQALAQVVDAADVAGRQQAMEALVDVAGPHAVPFLQTLVTRGKPADRIQVLKILGDPKVGGKSSSVAARAIVPALEDSNETVVQQALASFGNVCTEDDFFAYLSGYLESTNLNLVLALVDGLARFRSARVITVLQQRLQAGPNKIRLAVLRSLEKIGTEDILPPLVEALGHRHIAVRTAASDTFVRLSRAQKFDVAPTIVWLLRSKDVRVRRMAAEIARAVPDPAGTLWPRLVAFIKDEDWWVRERVMDALVEMAGKDIAHHFISYFNDPLDFVRRYAVDVVARLKDRQALPALIRVSGSDPDWWVRERAVEAIASFADERTIPHLVGLMKRIPDLQLACLQALESMQAKDAVPHLPSCLQAEDPDVRLAALRCLRTLGDASHEAMVQPLLSDPDDSVRGAARALLAQWELGVGGMIEAGSDGLSHLDRMLLTMAQSESDDLILESGNRPFVKRLGRVVPMTSTELSEEVVWGMLSPHLSVAQVEELQALRDVDFSYEIRSQKLRFRANVFRHVGGVSAVFRIVRGNVPEMDSLGLPPVVKTLGDLPNGLVLVGGPTGSGKSTTLATLIDYINRNYGSHIISLEDPIEVIHPQRKGLITQREIGSHSRSFARALRSTLRQDPDVILIGEMRDMETIHFAITAADTGHLVFGTVHTVAADTAVDRLINVFPSTEQQQIRSSLANSLRAVICQYLCKRSDGDGRILASEVMLNTDAIANLIRKGKTFQIPSVMATSRDLGMQAMDWDLMRLFREGKISADEAYMKARSKKDFDGLFDAQKTSANGNGAAAGAPAAAGANGSPLGPRPMGPAGSRAGAGAGAGASAPSTPAGGPPAAPARAGGPVARPAGAAGAGGPGAKR